MCWNTSNAISAERFRSWDKSTISSSPRATTRRTSPSESTLKYRTGRVSGSSSEHHQRNEQDTKEMPQGPSRGVYFDSRAVGMGVGNMFVSGQPMH